MLFVRRQVENQVGRGDKLAIGANVKSIIDRVDIGGALFVDRALSQSKGDVKPTVAHVEALIQPLGSTPHDDDFFSTQIIDPISELLRIHEVTGPKLRELLPERQRVEIVGHARPHIDKGANSKGNRCIGKLLSPFHPALLRCFALILRRARALAHPEI